MTKGIQVAASILGLAGYVYLIGGIVSWVRFGAARLPSDAAVGALESRTLFEVGVRSIVLLAIAFAVASVVAYFAAGNWDANRLDWHEVVQRHGVSKATEELNLRDPRVNEAWKARRAEAMSRTRAERWDGVAKAAGKLRAKPIAKVATNLHNNNDEIVTAANSAAKARADRASRVAGVAQFARLGKVAEVAERKSEHHAALAAQPLEVPPPPAPEESPLGDRAVRVVAGFNNLVLSAVGGLAAARGAELILPHTWWLILSVWLAAGWLVHRVLAWWGPLRWGARAHGLAWVLVAAAALFVSAPVGLLVIAGVAVSTLGRVLSRVSRPRSPAEFLRSPLPWALLTFYTLGGLAYYAVPPVSFQRAVVTMPTGHRVGGYLSRSGTDVYLVTCTPLADATSTNERIVRIGGTEVKGLTLGGPEDRLDPGERPSLAALATRAVGIDAHPPTLFRVDLRARRATCAGAPPPSITGGGEDPALGSGAIIGLAPPAGQAHDGEPLIEQTTPDRLARLARLYQPTLEVTVADRFWPVSVGAVLKDVGSRGERTCLVSAAAPKCTTPTSLSSLTAAGSTASDYLRYPAPRKSNPTNQFQAFERGQYVTTGPLHHWLADPGVLDPWYTAQIYFYFEGSVNNFARWPVRDPNVPRDLIGLQYWFFYPYNYYPTVIGAGLMNDAPLAGDIFNTDLHQGDWEHVTVLLDPHTYRPVWLYMARHADEGQFVPWTSPYLAFDREHPIVQAAFGGHPSYSNSCGARPRTKLKNLSNDWVVCGSARFAFRAATTPLVDLGRTTWGCWKGHFGEAAAGGRSDPNQFDRFFQGVRRLFFVDGPPSPLWQAENGDLTHNTGVCTGAGPLVAERKAAPQLAKLSYLATRGARP